MLPKPYYETELGKLYCGDCLEILPHLEPVDLVLTDPPYNCGKNYGTCKDNLSEIEYQSWIKNIVRLCQQTGKNQAWIAPRYQLRFYYGLFPSAHLVVIQRGASGPFRAGWSDQFEIALASGKPNRCVKDLWQDIRLKGEGYFFKEETYDHPGYTPYQIMARFVELLSTDSVLDVFMGTGTTAVACERLNRRWIGIEISSKYCQIAKERIEREIAQKKFPGF